MLAGMAVCHMSDSSASAGHGDSEPLLTRARSKQVHPGGSEAQLAARLKSECSGHCAGHGNSEPPLSRARSEQVLPGGSHR